MTLSPVRFDPHRSGRREQMAIDNRARLKADLGAELTAQHLAGSNTGGGYGYLNGSGDVNNFYPSFTLSSAFVGMSGSCREGEAVVLIHQRSV